MKPDSLYVELTVDDDAGEALWEATQDPSQHERWDLRFSTIEYLPTPDDEPQEFVYATGLGPLTVEGTGTAMADRARDAGRANGGTSGHRFQEASTSSLVFRSEDPKALIRQGNGYWKYVPSDDGIRFLTEYNYETRYGRLGRLVDRLVFRPLMGWATAWSFDRLRLWVEDGVAPEASFRQSVVHAVARLSLAVLWVYQGLVPKLLVGHPQELALLRGLGLSPATAATALTAIGAAEVLFGVVLLALWHRRWPLALSGVGVAGLTLGAVATAPAVATGPFNPVATGLGMVALAVVGYVAAVDLPTARNCRREPPDGREW